jgi:hypothetical protein
MAFLQESANSSDAYHQQVPKAYRNVRHSYNNYCEAYPAAQPGLEALNLAVDAMVKGELMAFVENHLLHLPQIVRRLFSHYGVVGGCLSRHQWEESSYDATNVIYSSMWEYWKGTCRSNTQLNNVGNIVEVLLGVAWIHLHHHDMDLAWCCLDTHQDSVVYHGCFFGDNIKKKMRYSRSLVSSP